MHVFKGGTVHFGRLLYPGNIVMTAFKCWLLEWCMALGLPRCWEHVRKSNDHCHVCICKWQMQITHVYMYVYIYIYVCVYKFVYINMCARVFKKVSCIYPSPCPCLSICPSISLSISLSVYLSICLSEYLNSKYLNMYPNLYLSIYLSIYLSTKHEPPGTRLDLSMHPWHHQM